MSHKNIHHKRRRILVRCGQVRTHTIDFHVRDTSLNTIEGVGRKYEVQNGEEEKIAKINTI